MLTRIFVGLAVLLADLGCTLTIKQALTIKQKEMRVRVALRSRPSTSAGGGLGMAVGKRVKDVVNGESRSR